MSFDRYPRFERTVTMHVADGTTTNITLAAQLSCGGNEYCPCVDVGEAQKVGFPVSSLSVKCKGHREPNSAKEVLALLEHAVAHVVSNEKLIRCVRCGRAKLNNPRDNRCVTDWEAHSRLDDWQAGVDRTKPLCEGCWSEDFGKHMEREQAKEKAREKKTDARYKSRGYTHRLDAWIHAGDDDVLRTYYCKGEPKQTDIARILRRSVVKDDYRVTAL